MCLSLWSPSVITHLIGYTLYQSIEVAVLASVNDAAHDKNIKTTNTGRHEIAQVSISKSALKPM